MAALAPIDAAVHVEIPEDVRLSFPLAGPAPRLAAYAIDLLLRGMIFMVFAVSVAFLGMSLGGASIGLTLLALFVLEWGYGFVFEMLWNGQTPGKRVFGLRVVKEGGYAIGPYDAMVRNLLRAADVLPLFYGVGLVSMLATTRLQRLGDIAAGTMVIRETRHRLRREIPELGGVRKLTPDELGSSWRPTERTLDLLYLFALRRDSLPPARAREIATLLAQPLRRRLAIRTGDTGDPDTFLLRVLRTFHQARA